MFSLIENLNPERIHANMSDDGLVYHLIFKWGGRHDRDRKVVGCISTCAINTYHNNVVSSNPYQAIQHNVVKLASDLRQVGGLIM